jgi:hypothetical protein
MIAGIEAPTHGEAKNSWLTGTAAWNYVAITQCILGIRAEFGGLRIEACAIAAAPAGGPAISSSTAKRSPERSSPRHRQGDGERRGGHRAARAALTDLCGR